MSKTNELKKIIKDRLLTIAGVSDVYYRIADDNALYPHVVFDFPSANLDDLTRNDYTLEVHVWNYGTDTTETARIADDIEQVFRTVNLPQASILPTFFTEGRQEVDDEDTLIQHLVIQLSVQLYERN